MPATATTPTELPTSNPHNPEMTNLRFGVEIESLHPSCSSRPTIANRMAEVMGAGWTTSYAGGYYDKVELRMPDGRAWTLMSDGSISGGTGVEVVSPILVWTDMPILQDIVRCMRAVGLKVNDSCGIHVHVDGARFLANPSKIVNLVKLIDKREGQVHDMLGGTRRGSRWCRDMSRSFADAIKAGRATSVESLRTLWYQTNGDDSYCSIPSRVSNHYDGSRYHGLNLHSLFFRGTIEFRYFDHANLHAGKIRAYVCLVLALAGRALAARSISADAGAQYRSGVRGASNMLYHELGLRGAYFDNARKHLAAPIVAAAAAAAPVAAPRTRRARVAICAELGV